MRGAMDIARLLTCESDERGDEPEPATRHGQSRPLQRPRKVDSLRSRVEALEWVAANLDSDSQLMVSQPLSALEKTDAMRMHRYLIKSRALQKEVDQELRKRRDLVAQLRQYEQGTAAIRRLMRGMQLDDWFWKCERWRAIIAEYFKPFSKVECARMVEETMRSIATYKLPEEVNENKPSVFGWRDARGLGGDHRRVHFSARKTHYGSNLDEIVAMCWRIYQDEGLFHECMVGDRVQLFHQILQQETMQSLGLNDPNLVILQTVEKYPGLPVAVQSLYLVVLEETATGYMIAIRCIEAPGLHRAMQSEGMTQGSTFCWSSWNAKARDEVTGVCSDFVTSVNGYIGASDPTIAQKWMVEGLLALVRLEARLYGVQPVAGLSSSVGAP